MLFVLLGMIVGFMAVKKLLPIKAVPIAAEDIKSHLNKKVVVTLALSGEAPKRRVISFMSPIMCLPGVWFDNARTYMVQATTEGVLIASRKGHNGVIEMPPYTEIKVQGRVRRDQETKEFLIVIG